MAEKMFMRVNEVAEALDVSEPYAYKLIRQLNEELKITVTRIDQLRKDIDAIVAEIEGQELGA